MRNILCLLCFKINEIWCVFLDKFKHYKIFIIIDCRFQKIEYFKNKYKNITFLRIDSNECINAGYYNSVNEFWTKPNHKVISWDKALYYFSRIFKNYDNVWLLEDDVFFYDENTIIRIDKKNKNSDLIIKNINPKINKFDINKWHWAKLDKFKDKKWENLAIHSLVCCIRLSKKYLNCLSNYIHKYKKLQFIEILIPTLAIVHKLNIKYEENLKITYRRKFKNINRFNIYHPFKNLKFQCFLKSKLKYIPNLYINEQYSII